MLEDIPIFFTKNYVNLDDVITYSSGTPSGPYAFDWDKDSQWESIGSDDTVEEMITVQFYEADVATPREFDSLFLLNHNLKEFDFQTSNDGISWTTIPTISWPTANASFDTFIDLRVAEGGPGALTKGYIRLRARKTITADQEKAVGELVVCLRQYQLENAMEAYREEDRQSVRDVELGDSTIDRVEILHDTSSYQKYQAQVGLRFRSRTEKEALKAIKYEGENFIFWPEPVSEPRDLFFCRWENAWGAQYSDVVKGSGFDIDIYVREI